MTAASRFPGNSLSRSTSFLKSLVRQRGAELALKRGALREALAARKRAEQELYQLQRDVGRIVETRTRALKESELHYRRLFEAAPVGIGVMEYREVDSCCNALTVNGAMEQITGFGWLDLQGVNIAEWCVNLTDRAQMTHALYQVGVLRNFEVQLTRKDGGRYTAVLNVEQMAMDGRSAFLVSVQDVTERRYTRSLIEASLDPLVTIGADGRITDVNNATEGVTGYSREEIIGSEFFDYFTDPEKARFVYQLVFREGMVRDYALDVRHRDGRLTPVLYNASLYRDSNHQVLGVFAAARDISQQKKPSMN